MASDDTDQDPSKTPTGAPPQAAKPADQQKPEDFFLKLLVMFLTTIFGVDPNEQNFGDAPEHTAGKQGDYKQSVTDYYKPENLTTIPHELAQLKEKSGTGIQAIVPVEGNVRITSQFGEREAPKEGASTEHKGLDIAPEHPGEKLGIIAPMPGVVVAAGWKKGYGNTLDIMDINGDLHRFGHLDSFAVKVGEKVTQGEHIAVMGETGNATGVHLHYEQRNAKGEPVNPVMMARNFHNGDRITLAQNEQFLAMQKQEDQQGTVVADSRPAPRPDFDALLAQMNAPGHNPDYVSPVTGKTQVQADRALGG